MTTPVAITDITAQLVESDVQRMFDAWGDGRNGWRVRAPGWLTRCGRPEARGGVWVKNYDNYLFHSDVCWRSPEWVVMELKRAKKMEPLALAEVFHHAWHLGQQPPTPGERYPVPAVLVTANDSGAWCRAALRYLFQMGLRRDAVRYLEASYFEAADGQRYALFEEPFANITRSGPPHVIPHGWEQPSIQWSKHTDSETWIGAPESTVLVPSVVPEQFALVSRVDGQPEYVVYQQGATENGTTLHQISV